MQFPTWIKKAMTYLGMSLLFSTVGYGLIYLAAEPIISPALNLLDMISFDADVDLDQEQFDSLFDPNTTPGISGGVVKASEIELPRYGTKFGQLTIEQSGVDAALYFGDGNAMLRKGVGQYIGSSYPGAGGTVLIAGHNQTYFKGLKNIEAGHIITLKTNYGTYQYRVTETAVKTATDSTAYDLAATKENLVLYTCYPFSRAGLTSKRFFVYAEYVSGPTLLLYE